MKNLIQDPHFEKSTLWILDFKKNQKPNEISNKDVDLVFSPEFVVDKQMGNMTDLEQIRKDQEALQSIEKLCETLKNECLEELEKGESLDFENFSDEEVDKATNQVAKNLEALEELVKRFCNILKRFDK